MARKPKSIDDTHNFGVPSADDEGEAENVAKQVVEQPKKALDAQAPKKQLPKNGIENHPKFDKFKKGAK